MRTSAKRLQGEWDHRPWRMQGATAVADQSRRSTPVKRWTLRLGLVVHSGRIVGDLPRKLDRVKLNNPSFAVLAGRSALYEEVAVQRAPELCGMEHPHRIDRVDADALPARQPTQ
jgi:hypothetical protein